MLFNTTIFLFGFLPITLLLFFLLGRFSIRACFSNIEAFTIAFGSPARIQHRR